MKPGRLQYLYFLCFSSSNIPAVLFSARVSPFQLRAGQLGECLPGALPVALLLPNRLLAAAQACY